MHHRCSRMPRGNCKIFCKANASHLISILRTAAPLSNTPSGKNSRTCVSGNAFPIANSLEESKGLRLDEQWQVRSQEIISASWCPVIAWFRLVEMMQETTCGERSERSGCSGSNKQSDTTSLSK